MFEKFFVSLLVLQLHAVHKYHPSIKAKTSNSSHCKYLLYIHNVEVLQCMHKSHLNGFFFCFFFSFVYTSCYLEWDGK